MRSVWQTCRKGRRAAGFLGGLLVALLLAAGPAAGQTFGTQMTLSNGGEATSPVMAVGVSSSEVKVYVAWIEGNEVWFKAGRSPLTSADSCTAGPGPLVFGEPRSLSSVNPSRPAIATNDRGDLFVAWVEMPFTGGQSIRLWRSVGGTESFQSLNFNGVTPNLPAIAADNSGVFVAAEGSVPGATRVWLARSLDGAPFDYVRLSPITAVSARRPSIALDASKVHVVWRNGGVWYRGFDRSSTQTQMDDLSQIPNPSLTSAPVQFPPKVAAHGGEVTAAWFEGTDPLAPTDLKAVTTTGGIFPAPGSAPTVHSSTLRHSNLSLSVGSGGRLFGWQEADTSTGTSSNHYLLQAATARPFDSGSSFEISPGVPAAGPSAGLDAAGRVIAAWREGVAPATLVKLGYDGGSGSGGTAPVLEVRHAPETLNAKTMYQGNGVFNFWIRGVQGEIDLNSVKVNDQRIRPIRSAVDANGDLHLTFYRSDLRAAFDGTGLTAAHRNGNYTITGSTSSSCFTATNQVHIIR